MLHEKSNSPSPYGSVAIRAVDPTNHPETIAELPGANDKSQYIILCIYIYRLYDKTNTLQGTNISPLKVAGKKIFLQV